MANQELEKDSHCLIVDDDPGSVQLLRIHLAGAGLRVTAFLDPEEAWSYFQGNSDKVGRVVTDLAMPGMSGVDLIRNIRCIDPVVPIAVVSGEVFRLSPQEEFALSREADMIGDKLTVFTNLGGFALALRALKRQQPVFAASLFETAHQLRRSPGII